MGRKADIVVSAPEGQSIPEKDGSLQGPLCSTPTEVVLVHQPGKVGSSSLYLSMVYSLPVPAFQTHAMNRALPQLTDDAIYHGKPKTDVVHLQKSQHFIRYYLQPGKQFAMVTLIRDPISRNVSAFFQNIDKYPSLAKADGSVPVEEYQRVFLEEWDHDFADRWFDYHLYEPFGVDWYSGTFDPDQGFSSLKYRNDTFMLLQVELPDKTKENEIGRFLGCPEFRMNVKANVGGEKQYAAIYKEFKALPLPVEYLDRMSESRVARHFYTPQHIDVFRTRWS